METIELEKLGIDVATGLPRFAGKLPLYTKTLRKFAEEALVDEVREISDSEEFGRYIHTLKGVAGNLSILKVSELARDFEATWKNGMPDAGLYAQLCESLKQVATGILAVIPAPEQPKAKSDFWQCTQEEAKILLRRLRECLQEGQSKVCDEVMEELKSKRWEGGCQGVIDEICNAVDSYNYRQALSLLETIT